MWKTSVYYITPENERLEPEQTIHLHDFGFHFTFVDV